MAELRKQTGQMGRVVLTAFVALLAIAIVWVIVGGSGLLPGDNPEGTATSPAGAPTAPTAAQ
jgi:hypothetical protein